MDAGNNGRAEAILQDGGAVVGNDDGRLAVLVPVVNEPFQRRACKVRGPLPRDTRPGPADTAPCSEP